jgi:hypothetical protein
VERGDTGLGRDAYGPPGRERDRRGYGPGPYPPDEGYSPSEYEEDDAAGSGRPVDVEEDDYGQLLRRPGEMPPRQQRLRQPGPPPPGQPGRFPPGGPGPHGGPPHSGPPQGGVPHGGPPNGGPMPGGGPAKGGPLNGGPLNGGPLNGGPAKGGPVPGRQHRLPNGRRVPPGADRLNRPPGPATPGGTSGRHHGPGPAVQDPYVDSWSRPSSARGGPPAGGPVPPGPAPGPVHRGPQPSAAPAIPGLPGSPPPREHPAAGPRFDAPDGRDRLGLPTEPPGPVIRRRETAGPEDRPGGPAQPVASIAPDGLEAFARDLRALRAKADLDYPEMAETSHYEMKTLAAAAGGLRLPSLPVAVAFVRACDGNVAEWEERWQKVAEKITADAAKKRRNDGEETAEPLEPADAPAALESPHKPAAAPPDPDGGEVYVITSAKPRPPGW